MTDKQLDVTIYRVIVFLSSKSFTIDVTDIKARKTANSYLTEHGKRLRLDRIGKPDTRTLPASPIYSTYVEREEDIDPAANMLIERIRQNVTDQYNHFARLVAMLDHGPNEQKRTQYTHG